MGDFMKFGLCALAVLVFVSHIALANDKCLSEAKMHARLFSATENLVSVDSIEVKDSFFHSESRGILYYGILLDNREQLNIGLRKKNCKLSRINYVTDGL